MKNIGFFFGLCLFLFFYSCHSRDNRFQFVADEGFYDKWNAETRNEFTICCKKDSAAQYVSQYFRKSLRHRRALYATLLLSIKTVEATDSIFVQEDYIEESEQHTYNMTVFVNKKGREARIYFRCEMTVDEKLYDQPKDFEKVSDCCLFSHDEYKSIIGNVPVTCETIITFDKAEPRFEVSLMFN